MGGFQRDDTRLAEMLEYRRAVTARCLDLGVSHFAEDDGAFGRFDLLLKRLTKQGELTSELIEVNCCLNPFPDLDQSQGQ